MSTLKARNIEPATGTDVALGASGDTVTVSGDSLTLDTFKDSGGNTLFTSNGSGTLSSVNSALKGNGPILISSQTDTNSSGIAFTSGIDSTYDKYMFVFPYIHCDTNTHLFQFQVNASGQTGYNETITSTFFDADHREDGAGGSVQYNTGKDQAQGTAYQTITSENDSTAASISSGILYLYSPSNTTYVTHFHSRIATRTLLGGNSNQLIYDCHCAGYINTTAAITEINFKSEAGTFDAKIKMYGIA